MKRTLVFLLLFIKRLCKKPSFLIILLLMPVLVFGLRMVLSEDDETIYVALYGEGGDEKVKAVISDLVNSSGGVYYYEAESAESLRADVLTEYAECGFLFKEGLWEAMVNEEAEGYITLYQNTKTTNADFIKEKVYSDIYYYLSFDSLTEYIKSEDVEDGLTDEEREAFLFEIYLKYVTDGGVFNVSYVEDGNTIVENVSDVTANNSYLMKPVRNVLAIFMLMAAMAGAVFRAIDEQEGVYKTLGYNERPFVNLATIFLPSLMATMVALVSLYIGGTHGSFVRELCGAAVYCVLLTGFANLIRSFTSNATFICSLLPMLAVISIICCNVIVNVSKIVPGVAIIKYIVPPSYYLERTDSLSGCLLTFGVGVVFTIIGVIIDRSRKY